MDQARSICVRDVNACSSELGIIAGRHHFVDLWARDSLFATFGAYAKVSKKTIETFLRYQRADGFIPYRILRSPTTIGKYFGKPRYYQTPRADFWSHQSGGLVLDGGLMTIIAAHQLNDKYFLQKHKNALRRIEAWYEKKFGDELLWEWFLCEWADAVLKVGKTLYTNILYWKATGKKTIAEKIVHEFWNGRFFADWIDYKRQDYFASHANMLAIVFDLATQKQAESILAYAKRHCWNGWTLETNYPRYPFWRIPIHNYLVGMGDYHNRGCLWLQQGILYAIALKKVGQKKEAEMVFEKISKKIIEYNGVYEVYEKSGEPVRRVFYQGEHPFAWSSGLYLWAYRDYFSS